MKNQYKNETFYLSNYLLELLFTMIKLSKKFVAVKFKYTKMLKKSVSLESIKKNKDLKHLSLIKQNRLSVMPIDSKSWKILNKMSNI